MVNIQNTKISEKELQEWASRTEGITLVFSKDSDVLEYIFELAKSLKVGKSKIVHLILNYSLSIGVTARELKGVIVTC